MTGLLGLPSNVLICCCWDNIFLNFPLLNYCRKVMPPLQCSMKMPELLCSRLPVLEARVLLHSSPHRLICVASRRWSSLWIPCCCSKAAPGTSASSHKASWSIHTLQCLLWSWSQMGSVVNIGSAALVTVYCPWAFLSLRRKPWGTLPLVFWLVWIKFLDRAHSVPVLLSEYLKSWEFLIVFCPYFWFFSSW